MDRIRFVILIIVLLLFGFVFGFFLGVINAHSVEVTGVLTYSLCIDECAKECNCVDETGDYDEDQCEKNYCCAKCVDACSQQLDEVLPKRNEEIMDCYTSLKNSKVTTIGEHETECFVESLIN